MRFERRNRRHRLLKIRIRVRTHLLLKQHNPDSMRRELHARWDEAGHSKSLRNRTKPFSFSKRLYKLRWRIESAFNRLKDFRRIATPTTGWPETTWPSALPPLWYGGFNEP